ncbi:MAG: GAF domain-containing protein, partial [Chloroflexota bacterium]
MITILHIDQDETRQKLVKNTLGADYNLVVASDGLTAIQYCAMIQPDLILLNIALPNTDTTELVDRLNLFLPQIPILHIVNDIKTIPLSWQSSSYLTTPLQAEPLQRTITTLLKDLIDSSTNDHSATRQQLETQIAELNKANKRLASLNTISALIGTSLDLEHLTDAILTQIHKTVDFDSATLFLLKGDVLEAAASRGLLTHNRGLNKYRRSKENSAWRVVEHKLPLILNEVAHSSYWELRPELDQVHAWLGIPLIYRDRVVGVLTLDKNEPNSFTDIDARYLFVLSYQIAIAVENAQLFEGWEEQAARLKLITEVTQEINTILDIETMFQRLGETIFKRLPYDWVLIFQVGDDQTSLYLKASFGDERHKGKRQIDTGNDFINKAIKNGGPILINNITPTAEIG